MDYSIFDIETNGLLYEDVEDRKSLSVDENGELIQVKRFMPVATKIHCMSVLRVRGGEATSLSFTTYEEMAEYLETEKVLVGHNIIRFDIPVLEKFLNISLKTKVLIDTLALSWYLYPTRKEHGLEVWGEELGIAKPVVADWENDTIETYLIRCQEDVKINTALFNIQKSYLKQLYNGNSEEISRIIGYLHFKLACAREQEEQKWKLNVDLCKASLKKLLADKEEKIRQLAEIMPKVVKYKIVSRPKVCFKKDGTTSEHGKKWFELLKEKGLPDYHNGAVKVPIAEETGNPGSHQQLKDWLFSLGWKPANLKQVKDKETGATREIPQLSNQDGTDVCDSVKALYEGVPELEALEGFFVIRHRIGLLEGFIKNVDSRGYLKAQVKGFTNTLRFQHTTLVNLPTIPKPYWEEIRGCLITSEGYELCGSDMSSLEDNTKHHYMMYFDPVYVKQMRTPGFDAHIDIAVRAKALSYDEGEFYKWYNNKKEGKEYKYTLTTEFDVKANHVLDKIYTFNELIALPEEEQAKINKIIKPIRLRNKKGNFASVYGAGKAKLALTLGVDIGEAAKFHRAYWERNKAVKQVAQSCITKKIGEQMWLFNPVSKFWYSLREEKDKFSTLNQGTGVYCFDTWVSYVRWHGVKLMGQFHDEIIFRLPLGKRKEYTDKLQKSIQLTNDKLRLNVPLKISVDFGNSYADIH